MRKKLLPFITIAIMVFFAACSKEDLLPEANAETKIEGTRTLTLNASIGEPTPRVALEQDGKNIELTWVAGDTLVLAFVQGSIKAKETITLTAGDISNGGKNANFDIPLPVTSTGFDDTADFNLYGVYGGGGIDISQPNPRAILPSNAGDAGSLSQVEEREDVMLYFASKDINASTPQISVNFTHLGSLFSFTFKNNSSQVMSNLKELRVTCNNPVGDWAYNTGPGGQAFDLANEVFLNTGSYLDVGDSGYPIGGSGYYISFGLENPTIAIGDSVTSWAWYPPLTDVEWPELFLQVVNLQDEVLGISLNSKPLRESPTPAGRTFHFYARWDGGTGLYFTNDQFNIPSTLTIDVQLPTTTN